MHEIPKLGIKVTPKQDDINKHKKNMGYFVLASNGKIKAFEALSILFALQTTIKKKACRIIPQAF